MSEEIKFVEKEKFANTDFDKYAENNRGEQLGGVIPFLAPLMFEVIKRNPQWTFVAVSGNYHERLPDGSRVRLATRFNVLEKREVLGYVGYDRSYSRGDQYVVGNDRISSNMERQSHTKTTKLDVALRQIKKHFSPATVDEYFNKAIEEASNRLHRTTREADNKKGTHFRVLHDAMNCFIDSHWDMFVDNLNDTGKEEAKKLKEAEADALMLNGIQNMSRKGEAYQVLIKESEYVIKHKEEITVIPTDKLPQELKLKLGMLKLVPVGQMIAGMGYRGTEDCFIITLEEN